MTQASQTTPYRRLPRNRHGRDLIIGDIHGHFSRVQRELERLAFDPERDRLICVGDLVDRGPESALAAEWLQRPWFHAVMGNHDASVLQRNGLLSAKFELFMDYHHWLEALESSERARLRDALAALPWALEIESAHGPVAVVHAEVPQRFAHWHSFLAALEQEEVKSQASSGRYLARQALDLGDPQAAAEQHLEGVVWAIHGHTPRPYCRIGQLGNRLWIDTRGWYDEPLERGTPRYTIIDIDDPLTPL